MSLHFEGLLLGLCTFLIIGICHPLVIYGEYHFGTRLWWVFLLLGAASVAGAVLVASLFWSGLLGVLGFTFFWGIKELFEQRQRVLRGWFPMNPKRKAEYERFQAKP